jgi:hypothetical protein
MFYYSAMQYVYNYDFSVFCTELSMSDISYFLTGTFSSISVRSFPLLFGKRI